MQMEILIRWMTFLCFSMWAAELTAQPQPQSSANKPQEAKQDLPEGFELQPLKLGGEILKPVGWKFESREIGKTLVYKMWEPVAGEDVAFDTGVSIDIVTNIADVGQKPSQYAESYIEKLSKEGKVVKTFEPTTTNDMIQSGILLDQKLTLTGTEKEYRIRYVVIADDKEELLYVLSFGTTVPQWETYAPRFRVMSERLKLIDSSKK